LIVGAGVFGNPDTISQDVQFGQGGGTQFLHVQSGGTLNITGHISGSAEGTKEDGGTLILTNNNSGFTGPFTLVANGGVVRISNNNALGSGASATTVRTNAQLQIDGSAGPLTIAQNIVLNGSGGVNTGALLNVAGNNIWTGSITLD